MHRRGDCGEEGHPFPDPSLNRLSCQKPWQVRICLTCDIGADYGNLRGDTHASTWSDCHRSSHSVADFGCTEHAGRLVPVVVLGSNYVASPATGWQPGCWCDHRPSSWEAVEARKKTGHEADRTDFGIKGVVDRSGKHKGVQRAQIARRRESRLTLTLSRGCWDD